jgi:hypothetical protein
MKRLLFLLSAATGTCAWAQELSQPEDSLRQNELQTQESVQQENDSVQDDLQYAVSVLVGQDTTQTREWALNWLLETQDTVADASVQNLLGMAYMKGWGTEADTARAVGFLQQSVDGGYAPACHNLGMYYKYAPQGKQDFGKAYGLFREGANLDDGTCCYDCAFMLYKGLGTSQSYAEAIPLLEKAAEQGHADAIYMLGLCYRNGYGVEPDSTLSYFFLNMAAGMEVEEAAEELHRPLPENMALTREEMPVAAERQVVVEEEMPSVVSHIPLNRQVLAGRYEGVVVTYDWSGEWALKETPLTLGLEVTTAADTVKGSWQMGTDTIGFHARLSDDGTLHFDKTERALEERYAPGFWAHFRFEQAAVNYRQGMLTGRLRLYSLDEQEPGRPMYVSLRQTERADGGSPEDEFLNIVAYVSPNQHTVTLKFELPEDVPSAQVGFYNQNGLKLSEHAYGALPAGVTTLTLHPSLTPGYYAIRVQAGTHLYQTLVVI